MPADAPENTWGNHFITLVGFGLDPLHGEYLLMQNSWGEIYDMGDLPKDYSAFMEKTSFLKMCTSVAGKGKLEVVNRYSYEPLDLVVYDSENGQRKEGGSFAINKEMR